MCDRLCVTIEAMQQRQMCHQILRKSKVRPINFQGEIQEQERGRERERGEEERGRREINREKK